MEAVNFLSAMVMFTLLCGVSSADLRLLNGRVNAISSRFNAFEDLMFNDRANLLTKQEERIASLRTELQKDMRQHVNAALSEILQGESFEDIIKSEVVSEMRHLKRTNHQMRRQLHQMMTSLGQVREDNRMYGDALLKVQRENAELMSMFDSSKCLHCENVTTRLLEHNHQISQINKTLMTVKLNDDEKKILKENESPLEPTTVPTQLTTPDPQEERSRILVAPMWSFSSLQFRQLTFYNNSLDIYSYLNLKKVNSVVYVSKLDSILIGLYSPNKIISSKLHTSRVVTVRHNVRTYGMAADEKRGIIFLTTVHPRWTISRMSLQGRHYTTVVNLVGYGDSPRAIAVHPDTQVIFSCNHDKLFSVRYDGSRLTTLDTGSNINAVTLDISNSLLYYSNYKKLMKRSLYNNTTSEVSEFSFNIWNLLYYLDTVYYISINKSPGTLGSVDVGQNNVSYTLQTVNVSGVGYFAICLIP